MEQKYEYHEPVMVDEVLEGLIGPANGVYVDATFGGGGHARRILKSLGPSAKLVAFDQDDDAAENVWDDSRLIFCKANFRFMGRFLQYYGIEKVDGVFADLGVSSHQIDEGERGFSFNASARLDMRMNRSLEGGASDVLNTENEKDLADIFWQFGELRQSRKMAKAIVEHRSVKKIETIPALVDLLEPFAGPNRNRFFAQVFQAIRIKVNDEMQALQDFLKTTIQILPSRGRLVVLSYHSLEDRLVKRFMKSGNLTGAIEKDAFGKSLTPFRRIGPSVWVPKPAEIAKNPRSRSAKLRIAERI